MDPIATARYGLMAASQRFEASAQKIAGARVGEENAGGGAAPDDIAEGVVGLVEAKTAFKANVTVIKFAQDMWDSLLDLQSDSRK
jgi:flagellar basal body rod protein FlgC